MSANKKKSNGSGKPAADTTAKKVPAKQATATAKAKTAIESKAPAKGTPATAKAATTSAKTTPAAAKATPVRTEVPHDQVARRAYQLFVTRGGVHGHALEDWLTAEAEVAGDQR